MKRALLAVLLVVGCRDRYRPPHVVRIPEYRADEACHIALDSFRTLHATDSIRLVGQQQLAHLTFVEVQRAFVGLPMDSGVQR